MNRLSWIAAALLTANLLSSAALAQSSGRLLASNCFQCHGTNGNPTAGGFDRLAGKPEAEIYEELLELRRPPATVEPEEELMAVHANGFTLAELRLIARFFSQQQRR